MSESVNHWKWPYKKIIMAISRFSSKSLDRQFSLPLYENLIKNLIWSYKKTLLLAKIWKPYENSALSWSYLSGSGSSKWPFILSLESTYQSPHPCWSNSEHAFAALQSCYKINYYVYKIRFPKIHIGPIANMLLPRRNHVTKSTTTSIGLIN